jgi:hypothetical protein
MKKVSIFLMTTLVTFVTYSCNKQEINKVDEMNVKENVNDGAKFRTFIENYLNEGRPNTEDSTFPYAQYEAGIVQHLTDIEFMVNMQNSEAFRDSLINSADQGDITNYLPSNCNYTTLSPEIVSFISTFMFDIANMDASNYQGYFQAVLAYINEESGLDDCDKEIGYFFVATIRAYFGYSYAVAVQNGYYRVSACWHCRWENCFDNKVRNAMSGSRWDQLFFIATAPESVAAFMVICALEGL